MVSELSGKALGIAVAKAMGWMEWQGVDQPVTYPYWHDPDFGADELYLYRSLEECQNRFYDASWAPWRDMNDAMEVVHKLIAGEPWECYISHQTFGWECFFLRPDRADEPRGQADELPEAILLAALAAKGEE